MKKLIFLIPALLASGLQAQTYVNLSDAFNADAFLEPGGAGTGDALDGQGRRIDSATLPTAYTDGSTVTTQNGRATYKFGPLRTASLDAVKVDGQTIDVADGRYSSVDFAMLAAGGAFLNPFGKIEFNYSDSTKAEARLAPVAGWFSSPTVFDNAIFRFSDQSGVTEHVSFATNGEDDVPYLLETAQSALSGGWRFADGNGYFLYQLDTTGLTSGKLGITIGNNFIVSVASEYIDPSVTRTEGYTVLANSQEIYGTDHHSLGNLKEYSFDISEQLAAGTGQLFILLTDGSTSDGWGPFVQRIRLFDGEALNFEERLMPTIDTSDATVYANFQIASTEETPFLFDNNGAGPSNRGHRFADASGNLTYRFDLPDNVTSAKMTVDMENNFVVSVAGPAEGGSLAKFTANTATEAAYLVDAGGSATQPNARFADGGAYMIYEFDLADNLTTAFARILVGNQFVISAATGADGEYTVLQDYYAETGNAVQDNSNFNVKTLDISSFLANNPSKIVRIKLTDGIPEDGWGPYLRSIEIVDSENAGNFDFTEVLNSESMFGEDVKNESNRNYYTIDLTAALNDNNPGRVVYIRFTDASTADGWGPSLYWMSVYTGEIEINSDSLVFPALKTTQGDPASRPVGLLSRNYLLDPSKTLTSIKLPAHPDDQTSSVYLLAATLNPADSVAAPQLQVADLAGDRIRISWPATDGYRLQFAASLTSPAQWGNVAATPQNTGGTMSVELDTAGQQGFYRLIK